MIARQERETDRFFIDPLNQQQHWTRLCHARTPPVPPFDLGNAQAMLDWLLSSDIDVRIYFQPLKGVMVPWRLSNTNRWMTDKSYKQVAGGSTCGEGAPACAGVAKNCIIKEMCVCLLGKTQMSLVIVDRHTT